MSIASSGHPLSRYPDACFRLRHSIVWSVIRGWANRNRMSRKNSNSHDVLSSSLWVLVHVDLAVRCLTGSFVVVFEPREWTVDPLRFSCLTNRPRSQSSIKKEYQRGYQVQWPVDRTLPPIPIVHTKPHSIETLSDMRNRNSRLFHLAMTSGVGLTGEVVVRAHRLLAHQLLVDFGSMTIWLSYQNGRVPD